MYLEIDEGFDSHPKTVRLCRVMRDVNAGQYLIRIWSWACRSAPDGDLSGMEAQDVEAIAKYAKSDGKLFAALTETWSPKFGPWIDCDGTSLSLHGWKERQGAAIERMSKNAARMRAARERRKDARAENETRTCAARSSHDDGTFSVSPDKTRQDQTRQEEREPSPARDPVAQAPSTGTPPPANEPGKPSPRNVVAQYLAIRAMLVVGSGVSTKGGLFQQPQDSDVEKAAKWIAGMSPEECSDIEPAITLACKHVRDAKPGWNKPEMGKVGFLFGAIVRSWPDLREELHGCAPKAAEQSEPRRRPGEPAPFAWPRLQGT